MRAIEKGIVICPDCHQLAHWRAQDTPQTCERCGTRLYRRRPDSLARTWALLITAALLYLPANLLPIMTVTTLGRGQPDTLLSGVMTLIQLKMWPIAAVVFIASILVPTFKLLGIAFLLLSVQRRLPMRPRQRIALYRFIEWIGRWSMLDIFVIAVLVALVGFGHLASIEAGQGAVAFAAVVVLTMLAALSFDPRLLWDNTPSEDHHD